LISRWRETRDRRVVLTRIAPEGIELLARLDEPIHQAHRKQLGHLGRERLNSLARLLAATRSELP
jgi:DNA-binding MarR family transcriptional regulator